MSGSKRAMFISEAGWKGIREASLRRYREGLPVDIAIKGRVAEEVLAVITRPGEAYRIFCLPRRVFWPYLFFYFIRHKLLGDLEAVTVSKQKTGRLSKIFGFNTKLLVERDNG